MQPQDGEKNTAGSDEQRQARTRDAVTRGAPSSAFPTREDRLEMLQAREQELVLSLIEQSRRIDVRADAHRTKTATVTLHDDDPSAGGAEGEWAAIQDLFAARAKDEGTLRLIRRRLVAIASDVKAQHGGEHLCEAGGSHEGESSRAATETTGLLHGLCGGVSGTTPTAAPVPDPRLFANERPAKHARSTPPGTVTRSGSGDAAGSGAGRPGPI